MKPFKGDHIRFSGYHSYSRVFNVIGSKKFAVGLEMEVGNFTDRSKTINLLNELGIRDDFMMPTSDGSLDEHGIEFVTHPLGIDYLESEGWDVLKEVFDVFKKTGGKAEDATCSCGCHHNFSHEKLKSPEDWDQAIKVVFRYYDLVFKKFSGARRAEHYAALPSEADFLRACRSNGKYSFFNFRGNGVVELRFPAMTLDHKKFVTQTNLCVRAIEYAASGKKFDPLEETFHTIFKPTSDELEVLEGLGVHKRVLSGAY